MAVDTKLNTMIDALGRLERVRLEDVELSVRAHNGLKNDGCVTLADVQHRINKGTLRRIPNIGRRTAAEIQEIIDYVLSMPDEGPPQPDNVLREEDTEADLLRYENARLLGENKLLRASQAQAQLEPDRLRNMLQAERHNHSRTRRRLDALIAMMTVGDLRRAGIDVDITFNEED